MELFRTRCAQGMLVITEDYIRIELGAFRDQTLPRASLSSVRSKLAVFSPFGLGGARNLIFVGRGGEVLHADMVRPSVAKEIVGLLSHP